ncbi:HET-domain-containing protein [Byssothecium circinans]|uniref:HET-domain-containing protein n=1 Tax=Byssothecium circinans TaxID=147558 RepID=A0A6A5TA07_9PLEO|nr:HET-domain-containing protein [Byssothecium circinans]
MRLIHIQGDAWSDEPLSIGLISIMGANIPPYMILSYSWRDDEVLYADIVHPNASVPRSRAGYDKLEASCRLALQMGYQYAWIDTCCIDKSSSAELSEAINSMYRYYAESHTCFAYLDDVNVSPKEGELEASCWFTRGWTLQELIAPKEIYFYSKNWKPLGTKMSLRTQLSAASGIHEDALNNPTTLEGISISDKMSWAALRETTREEDESYSLLGLFGVNLPPLYGEGRERAFRRLQIEIMSSSSDHTIFAWDRRTNSGDMLAASVRDFMTRRAFIPLHYEDYLDRFPPAPSIDGPKLDYAMTNAGLHIQLPLTLIPHSNDLFLSFLSCRDEGSDSFVAICLQKQNYRGILTRYRRVCLDGSALFRISEAVLSKDCAWPVRKTIWIARGPDHSDVSLTKMGLAISMPRGIQLDIELCFYPSLAVQRVRGDDTGFHWFDERGDDQILVRAYARVIRGGGFSPLILKTRAQPLSPTEWPSITVAVGEVNDMLWVFVQKEFGHVKHNLGPDSFKFPGGYAWRNCRGLFHWCMADLEMKSLRMEKSSNLSVVVRDDSGQYVCAFVVSDLGRTLIVTF